MTSSGQQNGRPTAGQSGEKNQLTARGEPGDVLRELMVRAMELRYRNDLEEAAELYRQAARKHPHSAIPIIGLAQIELDKGDVAEARRLCARAREQAGSSAEALLELAPLLWRLNRPEEALQTYVAVLTINPRLAAAHMNVGCILQQRGLLDKAAHAFQAAIKVDPDYAQAYNNFGGLLVRQGKLEEAERAFRTACEKAPEFAEARCNLSQFLKSRGDFEMATEELDKALEVNPDLAPALRQKVEGRKWDSPDQSTVQHLQGLLARPCLRESDVVDLHFSLGKVYHDCGEYDKAFEHYRAGNERRFRRTSFRPEEFRAFVDGAICFFDQDTVHSLHGHGVDNDTPVFIVGMPRSGTTLIEQIVASHRRGWGAGELPNLGNLYRNLPRVVKVNAEPLECLNRITPQLGKRLAQTYLDFVRTRAPASALRIADKMPENFLYLGFISMLFPRARIIHCRRHPLDTALSIYFHTFTQRDSYEDDLRSIGIVYRGYRELMAHWHRVLPTALLDVDYEKVVSDPETKVREIIGFLGLPWDDRCLDFHKTKRPVYTASVAQVRKPIYTSSVGRWKSYEKHLAPLIETLGGIEE